MKKFLACILTVIFLLSTGLTASADTAQNGFSLEYHLYMEKEDHPRVEVKVSGLQAKNLRFSEKKPYSSPLRKFSLCLQ